MSNFDLHLFFLLFYIYMFLKYLITSIWLFEIMSYHNLVYLRLWCINIISLILKMIIMTWSPYGYSSGPHMREISNNSLNRNIDFINKRKIMLGTERANSIVNEIMDIRKNLQPSLYQCGILLNYILNIDSYIWDKCRPYPWLRKCVFATEVNLFIKYIANQNWDL